MRKIIFMLPFIFIGCMNKDITSIKIQYNISSEINLFDGTYVVHQMGKDDFHYNFPISEDEINEIKKSYNNQSISNYEKELLIVDDKPLIMPSTDIKYIINFSNGDKQVFNIKTDFRKNPLDNGKYKDLKVFVEKINNTIKSKEEIKKVEKSNILSF